MKTSTVILALLGLANLGFASVYCPEPDIEHGDPYDIGGGYRIKCHDCYYPDGHEKVYCDEYGWGKYPKCLLAKCFAPPVPAYGGYSPKFPFYHCGRKIKYECKHGYELKPGSHEFRKCIGKNKWDKTAPICVPSIKHCPTPPDIPYGSYIGKKLKYSYPDKVYYFCHKDYELIGKAEHRCQKNGVWDPIPPPKCVKIVKYCPTPPEIPYGSYSGKKPKYSHPDKVYYYCHKYYKLKGESEHKCQKNGVWDPTPPPVCVKKYCEPRDKPKYGGYHPHKSKYYPKDSITFYCDKGYYLVGVKVHVCQENEQWSVHDIPKCVKRCKIDYEIRNGYYEPKGPYYDIGAHVTFHCNDGYSMKGDSKFWCTKMGVWHPKPFPYCVKTCRRPYVEHGGVKPANKDVFYAGEHASYYCNEGYTIGVVKHGRCQANGEFDQIAKCKKVIKKCKKPFIAHGGVYPDQYWYSMDDIIEFYCKNNYKLDGPDDAKCLGDGWTKVPVCKEEKHEGLCKGICKGKRESCSCDYMCEFKENCCEDYYDTCGYRPLY